MKKTKPSKTQQYSSKHASILPLQKSIQIVGMARVNRDRGTICEKTDLPIAVINDVLQCKDHIMKIRRYLPDQEEYLTPQELNDVIAITEILREFERRTERLDGEVSDNELLENVEILKRVFGVEKMQIADKWLTQFRENSKCCMSSLTDFGLVRRETDVRSILEHLQRMLDAETVARFFDRLRHNEGISLKSQLPKRSSQSDSYSKRRKLGKGPNVKIKDNSIIDLISDEEDTCETNDDIIVIDDSIVDKSGEEDDFVGAGDVECIVEQGDVDDMGMTTEDIPKVVEICGDRAPENVQSSESSSSNSAPKCGNKPETIDNEDDDHVQRGAGGSDQLSEPETDSEDKVLDAKNDASTSRVFSTIIESAEDLNIKMIASDPIILSYLKMLYSTGGTSYNENLLKLITNNFMEMNHSMLKRIMNLYRVLLLLHYSDSHSSPEDLGKIMTCFSVPRIRLYLKNYMTYMENWRVFLNQHVFPIIFTDAYYEILSEYCRRYTLVHDSISDDEKTQKSWEVKNFLRYSYDTSLHTINSMLNISKRRIPISTDLSLMAICTDLQDRLNPLVMENIKYWSTRESPAKSGDSDERTFSQSDHCDLRIAKVESILSSESIEQEPEKVDEIKSDDEVVVFEIKVNLNEDEVAEEKVDDRIDDEQPEESQNLEAGNSDSTTDESLLRSYLQSKQLNNLVLHKDLETIDMTKGNDEKISDEVNNPSLPMIDDMLQCVDHISRIRTYVPDQQIYLTPQELNDVIAIMEILREFVRRTCRLGSEVSDSELLHNVATLKRIFGVEKMQIAHKWLPKFRENLKHCKKSLTFLRPIRSDELDVKSILEVLQPILDPETMTRFRSRLGGQVISLKSHPKQTRVRTQHEEEVNRVCSNLGSSSRKRKSSNDLDANISKHISKKRKLRKSDADGNFLKIESADDLNINMIALDPIIISYLNMNICTRNSKYNQFALELSIKNFKAMSTKALNRTVDLYRVLLLLHYSLRHTSVQELSLIMTCFDEAQIQTYIENYRTTLKSWHEFLKQRVLPTLHTYTHNEILCEYCRRHCLVYGSVSDYLILKKSKEVMGFIHFWVHNFSWHRFNAMFIYSKKTKPKSVDLSLRAIFNDLVKSMKLNPMVVDTIEYWNLIGKSDKSTLSQDCGLVIRAESIRSKASVHDLETVEDVIEMGSSLKPATGPERESDQCSDAQDDEEMIVVYKVLEDDLEESQKQDNDPSLEETIEVLEVVEDDEFEESQKLNSDQSPASANEEEELQQMAFDQFLEEREDIYDVGNEDEVEENENLDVDESEKNTADVYEVIEYEGVEKLDQSDELIEVDEVTDEVEETQGIDMKESNEKIDLHEVVEDEAEESTKIMSKEDIDDGNKTIIDTQYIEGKLAEIVHTLEMEKQKLIARSKSRELEVSQSNEKIELYEVVEDEAGGSNKIKGANEDIDDDINAMNDTQYVEEEIAQIIHTLQVEKQELIARSKNRKLEVMKSNEKIDLYKVMEANEDIDNDRRRRRAEKQKRMARSRNSPTAIKQEPKEEEEDNEDVRCGGASAGTTHDDELPIRIKQEPGLEEVATSFQCESNDQPTTNPSPIGDYESALNYLIALKTFARRKYNTEAIRIIAQLEDIFVYYKDALS